MKRAVLASIGTIEDVRLCAPRAVRGCVDEREMETASGDADLDGEVVVRGAGARKAVEKGSEAEGRLRRGQWEPSR